MALEMIAEKEKQSQEEEQKMDDDNFMTLEYETRCQVC